MKVEDRQTVLSVLVAASLSFVVVGIALLSALALTDRPRPALENALTIRPDRKPTAQQPVMQPVQQPEMDDPPSPAVY